ncbi:EAL domain-containing protein [Nocardia beijingensis]|uniref:EAL domain-containing protein n=1 Tax=Nocardia beijingensis TaxID=95162 RepID=UPI00340DEFDB
MEALVRWQHPTRGPLAPDTFVGIAEATNLASDIGDWVIRTACAQFAEWRRRRLTTDVILRIYVSPIQLIGANFVEKVETALLRYGIPGSSVCFEITENVAVQDLPRTQMTLEALTRLHVQIAIDDFGTGYNTLSHLKSLRVNTVKIDRSFVRILNQSSDNRTIVESIIGLGQAFELDVVAEGVETAAAAQTLLELGCYRAQGFLIAHPLPAGESRPTWPLERFHSASSDPNNLHRSHRLTGRLLRSVLISVGAQLVVRCNRRVFPSVWALSNERTACRMSDGSDIGRNCFDKAQSEGFKPLGVPVAPGRPELGRSSGAQTLDEILAVPLPAAGIG